MAFEKIRVFINGFGRIGRSACRILVENDSFELVGINDLYSFEQIGYLLKYDSLYGQFPHEIQIKNGKLFIDGQKIALFSQPDPWKMDLGTLDVDVLLQCTGISLTIESNMPFIENGVKSVIVSAPPSDSMETYIYGVNHRNYKGEAVISNSSCSANAIVPLLKITDRYFGLEAAMMSMYHSYTSYQKLLDNGHYSKDIRRTRSATQNIIPLMSGAAEAAARFFPHVKEKFSAKSIRLPVPAVTRYDLSVKLADTTDKEKVDQIFKQEIDSRYAEILAYTDTAESSERYIGDPHSAVVDLSFCSVVGEDMLRICAWQDNEYGYAGRLVDMARVVGDYTDG